MFIPIKLESKSSVNYGILRKILAGDIGGTKSNLALFEYQGEQFRVLKEVRFKTKDYNNVQSMISSFLEEDEQPDAISLGVAGPVIDGTVSITNLSWGMSVKDISLAYQGVSVFLINDLEATSYGLALLKPDDVVTVYESQKPMPGNIALIAPGTGLGESGLYFDGAGYHPFATEGGHCGFAPRTLLDTELFFYLSKQLGHVSWERVVSGKGIEAIFDFLSTIKKREIPALLQEAIERDNKAKVITSHAAMYDICGETVEIFLRYLAIESSNLALKMKATSGVFIGGGIIPNILETIDFNKFLENFRDCGRMRGLLEDVPVKIILNERTALLGAAYYGACQSISVT